MWVLDVDLFGSVPRANCWALVKTVMNLRVVKNASNFLPNRENTTISRKTLLHAEKKYNINNIKFLRTSHKCWTEVIGLCMGIYKVFARSSIFAVSVCLSLSPNKYITPFPHSVQTSFSCVG